jgi:hypothetical protein
MQKLRNNHFLSLVIVSRIWGCAWLMNGFGLMAGFIAHLYNLLLHFTNHYMTHYVFSIILDCRLQRLPPFFSQLSDPRYIASGRPEQKHRFVTITSPLRRTDNSSVVPCVFISAGTCLVSRRLTINFYSGSAIPAFRLHVMTKTILRLQRLMRQSEAAHRVGDRLNIMQELTWYMTLYVQITVKRCFYILKYSSQIHWNYEDAYKIHADWVQTNVCLGHTNETVPTSYYKCVKQVSGLLSHMYSSFDLKIMLHSTLDRSLRSRESNAYSYSLCQIQKQIFFSFCSFMTH